MSHYLTKLDDFLTFLRTERHLSVNTIQAYKTDISQFLKAYPSGTLTQNQVQQYSQALHQRGLGARSVNRKLSALKSFIFYLSDNQDLPSETLAILNRPKLPKPLPKRIPDTILNALFDPKLYAQARYPKRDQALIELLFSTGIRISECLSIEMSQLDHDSSGLRIIGKGDKERWVPIGTPAQKALKAYIQHERRRLSGKQKPTTLFITQKGRAFSRQGLYDVIMKYLNQVGNDAGYSPHSFRHTFATALLNGDADLRSVQELLGHASISSTQIYTSVSMQHKKKLYNQAHPRA